MVTAFLRSSIAFGRLDMAKLRRESSTNKENDRWPGTADCRKIFDETDSEMRK